MKQVFTHDKRIIVTGMRGADACRDWLGNFDSTLIDILICELQYRFSLSIYTIYIYMKKLRQKRNAISVCYSISWQINLRARADKMLINYVVWRVATLCLQIVSISAWRKVQSCRHGRWIDVLIECTASNKFETIEFLAYAISNLTVIAVWRIRSIVFCRIRAFTTLTPTKNRYGYE